MSLPPEERLKPCVETLVRAVEEGRDFGAEELVPVLGEWARGLGPLELDEIRKFIVSRLSRFPVAVRVAVVARLVIENRDGLARLVAQGVELRRRAAARLFEAVEAGRPVPFEACVAYGARSRYHARVLRDAVRDGRLSRSAAEAVTNDGAALNRLLGDRSQVSIPVRFRTAGEQAPLEEPLLREPFAVKTSAGTYRMLISNERELQAIAWLEPDLVRWLEGTLDAQSVFYDVGANIGVYSLYAARRAPGSRVVAFEPHPLNHAALVRNIVLNELDSVLPFALALSDRPGISTFGVSFLDSGSAGHTGLRAHEGGARGTRMDFETAAVFGAVVYTLDEFVRSATFLKPPTHLKIDVDGPELSVVRGAEQTLQEPCLRHLFVETGSKGETEEMAALFERCGFRQVGGNREAGNQVFER